MQTGCPRIALISASLQPALGLVVLYIFGKGRISSSGMGVWAWEAVYGLILGWHRNRMWKSKEYHIWFRQDWFRKNLWSSWNMPSKCPQHVLVHFYLSVWTFCSLILLVLSFLSLLSVESDSSHLHLSMNVSLVGFYMFIALQLQRLFSCMHQFY